MIAFSVGLVLAAVALIMTWAGGFAVTPALCVVAVAASVRRRHDWHRGRLLVAVTALLAASVVYALALASSS